MTPATTHVGLVLLAVAIAVLGTVSYAFGIAWQHQAVGRSATGVGFRHFLSLFKNPRWVGGLVLVFGSAACHLTALLFAPITIVQPIGILAIVWAVVLEARAGHKPTAAIMRWVAVAVIGLSLFVFLATRNTVNTEHISVWPVVWTSSAVMALAIVFALAGLRASAGIKSLLWAASAAVMYGVATGMIKVGLITLKQPAPWANPWLYVSIASLVTIYPIAAWIVQQSFAAGKASIAVGTMTTVDPIFAVAFGLLALGEGAVKSTFEAVLMGVGALLALGAVVRYSTLPNAPLPADVAEAEPGQTHA